MGRVETFSIAGGTRRTTTEAYPSISTTTRSTVRNGSILACHSLSKGSPSPSGSQSERRSSNHTCCPPLSRMISFPLMVCGPLALRYAKEAVTQGLDMPLAEGLALEARLARLVLATGDAREGLKAQREGRAPQFLGV